MEYMELEIGREGKLVVETANGFLFKGRANGCLQKAVCL